MKTRSSEERFSLRLFLLIVLGAVALLLAVGISRAWRPSGSQHGQLETKASTGAVSKR